MRGSFKTMTTEPSLFRDKVLALFDGGTIDISRISNRVGIPRAQVRRILMRSGRIPQPLPSTPVVNAPKPPKPPRPTIDEAMAMERYRRTVMFLYGDVEAREGRNQPDLDAWNRLGDARP